MEPKVLTETYAALVRTFPSSSSLFASIRQQARKTAKQLQNISLDISPDRVAHFLTMETIILKETYAALVRHFPSLSSLFDSIKQQTRESTQQLRSISPDISPERVAMYIFFVLLYLVDPKLVDSGAVGEGAAMAIALDLLPFHDMAEFIATKLLKNPALHPVILQIIKSSVYLFAGEFAVVLGVIGVLRGGGMKIKSML